METLRLAHSTEIKEQAGNIQIPDLLRLSTNLHNPGRAIDPTIEKLDLGDFQQELINIKNEGNKDRKKQDKVGVYYINGQGLHLGNDENFFSGYEGRDTIKVEIDEPEINPENPSKYLPKEKSVGAIVHYSHSEPLPMPDNLLHLLLEDKHFKAATAAFFLTRNENIFALFRTQASPHADIHRVRRIVRNMKTVQREFHWAESVSMQTANMCVLKEAIQEYGLLFFHGKLGDGQLKRSSPELHTI